MKKRFFALLLTLSLLLSGCTIYIELPWEEDSQPQTVSGDGLVVHFLDVGQADCALLECDGQAMLIDGGNVDDGQLLVSYLEQQYIDTLTAVICTHAHEDHVGGLPAVLAKYQAETVYAPVTEYSSKVFSDFVKYTGKQGLSVTIPSPGDTFRLGQAQVTFLGPVKQYEDTNNTSLVVKVVYGQTSFLFTGDMEKEAEHDLLDTEPDISADVLKVGHHGSDTSSGYRFLYEVNPTYGVISVGAGNSYGHPHEEVVSRLKDAGIVQLRTDQLGTIKATSDGSEITFWWENQNAAPEDVTPAGERYYVGNKNSKTFHAPTCGSLPAKKNQVLFTDYTEAVNQGYTPCRGCLG